MILCNFWQANATCSYRAAIHKSRGLLTVVVAEICNIEFCSAYWAGVVIATHIASDAFVEGDLTLAVISLELTNH